jgi:hypothetical protein
VLLEASFETRKTERETKKLIGKNSYYSSVGTSTFVVVEELEYPSNPQSYAVGSLATGRATLGGQVEE